jgi:hypothetical protein
MKKIEEPQILSEDELFKCVEEVDTTKLVSAPYGKGKIKLVGIKLNSEIQRINEQINLRTKTFTKDLPNLPAIPADIIGIATWLEHCAEPKMDFRKWATIAEKSGMWASSMQMEIYRLSGMTVDLIESVKEEIKKDPLEESTSIPV